MQHGFVCAELIGYDNMITNGGMAALRAAISFRRKARLTWCRTVISSTSSSLSYLLVGISP
jgi:hypothetical protein